MEDEEPNSSDETIQKYLFYLTKSKYKEKELSVYGIRIKEFELPGKFKYPSTNQHLIRHLIYSNQNQSRCAQSPTGYRKRTPQILRATHFYDCLM